MYVFLMIIKIIITIIFLLFTVNMGMLFENSK